MDRTTKGFVIAAATVVIVCGVFYLSQGFEKNSAEKRRCENTMDAKMFMKEYGKNSKIYREIMRLCLEGNKSIM